MDQDLRNRFYSFTMAVLAILGAGGIIRGEMIGLWAALAGEAASLLAWWWSKPSRVNVTKAGSPGA